MQATEEATGAAKEENDTIYDMQRKYYFGDSPDAPTGTAEGMDGEQESGPSHSEEPSSQDTDELSEQLKQTVR